MNSLRVFSKRKMVVIGIALVLLLGIILVPKVFASLQPIESVEIFSKELDYKEDEPGSWKIKKSAKWLSKDTAEITFDLNTVLKKDGKPKDYILVLDVSTSMDDDRFSRVKTDTIQLIENLLASKDSKIGLITFSTGSEIVSEFTDNRNELTEKVNNLFSYGTTNYYQALVNVETLLKDFSNDRNDECIVLFLTDGYPNEETPNEVWQYQYLKQQYPSLTINGIQYEMGKDILAPLKDISDEQYIADIESLNNVLFDAAVNSVLYDDFNITDYIDTNYFNIENEDDIEVNFGSFDFNSKEQKVTWNLNEIKSGFKAKMKIKVKIKDEFLNTGGNYPTNKKVEVSDTIGNTKDSVDSYLTPVLSNTYKVTYDGNAPKGCSLKNIPDEEEHFVFDVVGISSNTLSCSGYQFKGWDIVTSDVTMINSDYFTVSEKNVVIRAEWSKLDISKSVDGKVNERISLYEQVKADVGDSLKFAKKYTGNTSTFNGDKDVYYYYGEAANNNVLFANYCWKIVRTTDTGGVKLLYNGIPGYDGSCSNSGSASALTAEQMGTTSAAVVFDSDPNSPATVGYMYGPTYDLYYSPTKKGEVLIRYANMTPDTEYYYFDDVTYDSSYSMYHIDSKSLYRWGDSKQDLVGKYTCRIGAEHSYYDLCNKVLYTVGVDEDHLYGILLEEGALLSDKKMMVGTEITNNDDGTFALVNSTVLEYADWFDNYDLYADYYTCGTTETTCANMRRIRDISSMHYEYSLNYKFGRSFTYENGQYTLTDTEDYWSETSNYDAIDDRRYTCFNTTGQCDVLSYVYYINTSDNHFYYLILENGDSARDALNLMLYSPNVNTNNSNIKSVIDYWYQNNMLEYTKYLEDTVWCNNRYTMPNSWMDVDAPGGYLAFKAVLTNDSLRCDYASDRFTVSEANGNGKLTYPVGLLTAHEANLAYVNNKSTLASENNFWTISPLAFTNAAQVACVQKSGGMISSIVNRENDIRPSISLVAGIRYSYGNGTEGYPYVIELDSN